MAANPASRPARSSPGRSSREPRRRSTAIATPGGPALRTHGAERRRREQRFRQRRRDLLADGLIALGLAIIALIVAPGLGVIAIVSVPIALALAGTVLAERRARKRRSHHPRRTGRRRRT